MCVRRKCFWARRQAWNPIIRGGFQEEVSRAWKKDRELLI